MDVFHQRLEQEHGESVILTAPTVPYTLQLADGREERIQNPSKYPVDQKVCLSNLEQYCSGRAMLNISTGCQRLSESSLQ